MLWLLSLVLLRQQGRRHGCHSQCFSAAVGMVVRVWMWLPNTAELTEAGQEILPIEWRVQAEIFPPSNCSVPAPGGLSHCTRYHSSECLQQQCLTCTEAGGITVWYLKTPSFLDLRLAAQELPRNVGISLSSSAVWGYCLNQLL